MSDSASMNNNELFEGGQSKSSSQESGLCSTMMAVGESMAGSLEELTENLHEHLNTHIDHVSVLKYELDMLRSQLTEKNRLIETQQLTIKQLQDALNTTQKELKDLRNVAEIEAYNCWMEHAKQTCACSLEITCKNETIDILQTDLIDCQQQYASCLQQIMNQNRILSEIRDDDAGLVEKVAHLEKKLRKTGQTIATQTGSPERCAENGGQMYGSFKTLSTPPFSSPPSYYHSDRVVQPSSGSFNGETRGRGQENCSPPLIRDKAGQLKSSSYQQRRFNESISDSQQFPWSQFQDLLSEVRHIQKLLQSTDERKTGENPMNNSCKGSNIRMDDLTEFWNTITEERKQRLQLDHLVRKMELDILDVKTQVQSCKARLQNEQPPRGSPPIRFNGCPLKCSCFSSHQGVKYCCSCVDDFSNSHPKLHTSTSLFTLV